MADEEKNTYIDTVSKEDAKKEAKRIMKNIFLISLAFLMVFNAFQGLSRLQSSLHRDEGMGVINSSVLYGALVLSCLFVPHILINYIGHKWTIPLSFCGYILWMAANGYAVWGTMVTASILVGFAAAPLWTAQCSYFTIIAGRYAQITGQLEKDVVTRFFGIFFCFFQISGITGSIISATILKPVAVNENETDTLPDEDALQYCGIHDCPDVNVTNPNLRDPDSDTVWTMLGVYIAIACAAVIMVCLLVDRLPPELIQREKSAGKQSLQLLLSTVKHLRHKEMWLIIPLTMYSGFEQGSFNAEFSKSFVTCSVGIWKVGLVTIPFGCVNAVVSFTSAWVVNYTGRIPVFLAGMAVDLAIQITLMTWMPTPDEEYVLFILAAMWGFTDGIWQTQINAFYGVIFKDESEAAFSNYRMWESFGFIIAFAYSAFICTSVKIYVLTSVLLLGIIGYIIIEVMNKMKGQTSVDVTNPTDKKDINGVSSQDVDMKKFGYENEAMDNDLNEQNKF